MKLDLTLTDPEVCEPAALPPEEEAVRLQYEIETLKLRLEELQGKRDEAIALALKNGVRVYSGYRFGEKKPASSLSDRKFAAQYGELMDGYIEWYHKTHEAKLSKTELNTYLKTINHTNPDKVIADITEPGKGESAVTITKLKGGDE